MSVFVVRIPFALNGVRYVAGDHISLDEDLEKEVLVAVGVCLQPVSYVEKGSGGQANSLDDEPPTDPAAADGDAASDLEQDDGYDRSDG